MNVFNSLTRRNEELKPIEGNTIRLYTCGPTVYNFAHIGNFRAYTFEDILRRVIQFNGMKVKQVMNLTDVDDKTIKGANAAGVKLTDYTKTYKDAFFADLKKLNIQPAEVYPAATDHIPEMIALVQKLMEKGVAYQSEDKSVYFKVREFPGYGKLAHIDFDNQRTGLRCADDEYDKENVGDFALWKAWEESDGPVAWDSPWGKGRPGWHIECSAMSMKYLGETFDLHTGGIDNLFPHHENEIAQAEAATGKEFVKTWMHCAHLRVNGEKMSKSLGNFFTVRDIAKDFDLEAVRMFMLGVHYRNPVNFSRELIEQAENALERLRTARTRLDEAQTVSEVTDADRAFEASLDGFKERFDAAMDDDLNTADALGVLFELARAANTFVTVPRSGEAVEKAKALYDGLTKVLGLLQHKKEEQFPAEAVRMLEERQAARKAKDFKKADALRDALKAMGFVVEDTANGPKLKRA